MTERSLLASKSGSQAPNPSNPYDRSAPNPSKSTLGTRELDSLATNTVQQREELFADLQDIRAESIELQKFASRLPSGPEKTARLQELNDVYQQAEAVTEFLVDVGGFTSQATQDAVVRIRGWVLEVAQSLFFTNNDIVLKLNYAKKLLRNTDSNEKVVYPIRLFNRYVTNPNLYLRKGVGDTPFIAPGPSKLISVIKKPGPPGGGTKRRSADGAGPEKRDEDGTSGTSANEAKAQADKPDPPTSTSSSGTSSTSSSSTSSTSTETKPTKPTIIISVWDGTKWVYVEKAAGSSPNPEGEGAESLPRRPRVIGPIPFDAEKAKADAEAAEARASEIRRGILTILARHGILGEGTGGDEWGPPNPRAHAPIDQSHESKGDNFDPGAIHRDGFDSGVGLPEELLTARLKAALSELRRRRWWSHQDTRARYLLDLVTLLTGGGEQADYVINPKTLDFKPNPEDTNGPHGPSARLRNPSISALNRAGTGRLL